MCWIEEFLNFGLEFEFDFDSPKNFVDIGTKAVCFNKPKKLPSGHEMVLEENK